MKIRKYICPICGEIHKLKGFWQWFLTPHLGNKKWIKCCGRRRFMERLDRHDHDK